MDERIKDYFYFSRKEKNGIIVLLVFILILFSLPFIIDILTKTETNLNAEFDKEIELFSQSLVKSEEPDYQSRLDRYIIERYDSLKLFYFNPNNTTEENYKKLGLTDKQISTISNYLAKGGKFSVKDDFRKIYGIRQQQFQILKPYILLPDQENGKLDDNSGQTNQLNPVTKKDTLFAFDPNTATDSEFIKLGFSNKQVETIRNYISKGGKFYKNEDLKKIYGITPEEYTKLEPYIFIKKEEKKNTELKSTIELNDASFEQLVSIKGIGNYLAGEIIQYRQRLGGFTDKKQLLEIKGLKQESYHNFEAEVTVNPLKIRKLSLNFSDAKEFSSHPYLNTYQAKEIINYRTKNGPFKIKKELLDAKIILESTYNKIEPYLTIN
ncbi:MAG: helix-hairpin-helix domain-containing protein [Bacteroidales bacterium]